MQATQPPQPQPSTPTTQPCLGPGGRVETTTETDGHGLTVTREVSHSCPTCHRYH